MADDIVILGVILGESAFAPVVTLPYSCRSRATVSMSRLFARHELAGLPERFEDILDESFFREGAHDIRFEGRHRLAVVGFPIAVGHRDHHALSLQGLGLN